MCMITIKPKGIKLPPEEHLLKSEQRNGDGIGIAYSKEGKVVIKKDFKNAKDCYAWMTKHLNKSYAILIHQRLATSGLKDEGTRHPFPVVDDLEKMRKPNQEAKMAFAHNGVFYGHGVDKKYSDSMLVLKKFFTGLGNNLYTNSSVRNLIAEFVSPSNKIAFLNGKGKFSIFGNGWIEHANGCIYSNTNYEYTSIVKSSRILMPSKGYKLQKKKLNVNALPYHGKPPKGQPKKKYMCDECGKGKKSKWRGDLQAYVCAKCYKRIHDNVNKDIPKEGGLLTSKGKCYYCQSSSYRFRPELSKNVCDLCYRNQLFFMAKNKAFDTKNNIDATIKGCL